MKSKSKTKSALYAIAGLFILALCLGFACFLWLIYWVIELEKSL